MTGGNGPRCLCGHPRGLHSYDTGRCIGTYCGTNCQEFRESTDQPGATPPLPPGILDVGRDAPTLSELKDQADRMRGITTAKNVVTGGNPPGWSIALHHVAGGDPDEIRLFPRDGRAGGAPLVFRREESPATITQEEVDGVQVGHDTAGPYCVEPGGNIRYYRRDAIPDLIEEARVNLAQILAVQQYLVRREVEQREDRYARMWAALAPADEPWISWENAVLEEHPDVLVIRRLVDAGATPPPTDHPL